MACNHIHYCHRLSHIQHESKILSHMLRILTHINTSRMFPLSHTLICHLYFSLSHTLIRHLRSALSHTLMSHIFRITSYNNTSRIFRIITYINTSSTFSIVTYIHASHMFHITYKNALGLEYLVTSIQKPYSCLAEKKSPIYKETVAVYSKIHKGKVATTWGKCRV